jgi:hypothetical protein
MPAHNPIITVVREWLLKADHDLKTAAHTLTLGKQCPTDTVCFHAQQCVEKHIKACLLSGPLLSRRLMTFTPCACCFRRSCVPTWMESCGTV